MQYGWDIVERWIILRREAADLANPAARAAGEKLCEAMVAWRGGTGPRPSPDLAIDALRHRSNPLACTASTALVLIAQEEPDPLAILTRAYAAVPAKQRALLLRHVQAGKKLPRDVFVHLARVGLVDKSAEVRLFAIELIETKDLKEFLPDLRAIRDTADLDDLDYLDRLVTCMETGFRLTIDDDGWCLDYRSSDGIGSLLAPGALTPAGAARIAQYARECAAGQHPGGLDWDRLAAMAS